MARTKAQSVAYLLEIAEIVEQIRVMNLRKHELGAKLGYGSFRTHELPGIVVRVERGGDGWSISWKKVAWTLAKKLGLSESQFKAQGKHEQKRTHRNPTVAVCKDTANWNNPKLQFVA